MVINFTVHSDGIEEYPDKKNPGQVIKKRALMMIDASDGPRLAQLIELSLPAEHPEVGVGKVITVQIDEISAIFSGRPRVRGKLIPTAVLKGGTRGA
jgi:hypothetical protein